jgi:hypothetical protein
MDLTRSKPELVLKNMPVRQDTSPFGLCLTLGLEWRLVIQDFFGAHHVARPPNRQICWQAGNSGQRGFDTDVY